MNNVNKIYNNNKNNMDECCKTLYCYNICVWYFKSYVSSSDCICVNGLV